LFGQWHAQQDFLKKQAGSSPALKGTLLRIWEVAGKSGKIVLKLPFGTAVKAAQPVDLRGRPGGSAIPVKNDSFEVLMKAFAPASFELLRLG